MESHAKRPKSAGNMQEILASVSLVERAENRVIEIFDSADDKQAAGFFQLGQARFVLSEMLDFYGDVVRYAGKLAMKFFHKLHGVSNTVEEIRIAERNVLCAGGDLLANILQHDIAAHDAKYAFVNRNNGAMAAEMFAATAGLRGTDDAKPAAWKDEMRVFCDRRHAGAVRNFKVEPCQRDQRFRLRQRFAAVGALQALREVTSSCSNSPPRMAAAPSARR